jgi:NADH-quinone oxidoreductase subunit M
MYFNVYLLSFIVFFPALGAIVLAFMPSEKKDFLRFFTLVVTLIVLAPVLYIAIPGQGQGHFDLAASQMQSVFNLPWIPSFDIQYFMGFDGISYPLVALTAVVSVLACGASWSIEKHVKAYCILFLLLETGMLGVFLALDFFLFYVFWEVMLLPMYFLIGVWGGPRKEYAAIKFFLYTLLGSVLMLVAILMLYFASDLKRLNVAQLEAAQVIPDGLEGQALVDELTKLGYRDQEIKLVTGNTSLSGRELDDALRALYADDPLPLHTFNILAMQQMGQHTPLFSDWQVWNISLQHWAFWLLFIGFAIKVPSVPVHTWLPDAHVEAPTPISMILAGVLLKMGGYGILRMCYPICPVAGYDGALVVTLIGVVSMVYGAFAALAQNDFKRMVAYSSVSHMGYVVLGLGVWSMGYWAPQVGYNPEYWNMGVKGAMFQMIAHGISSAGMFFMVGVIYDRVHHRNLNEFGGLFGKMPGYTAMAIGLFFAGLGLPGLCGFVGEVLVVLSVWNYNITLAVISAAVVVLTAAYILWAVQRVYLGAEYKGPHGDHLHDMKLREWLVAVPLFVLAILFGVLPHQTVLKYMDATIDHQTSELAAWTRRHDEAHAELAANKPVAEEASLAANR